jgi:hypothetical protein
MPSVRETNVKVNTSAAADVLKAFIQEDRSETRLYRTRVQTVTWSLVVASFAISAFLIGTIKHLAAPQLRLLTLLIDLSLVAVILIFFWRLQHDLVLLRKAMKARQDMLDGLDEERGMQEIKVFPSVEHVKPDITDSDLYWVVGLSIAVVLLKMAVLVINAATFVRTTATH